jgi:ACS family tartrate transporter-like MFS transporter
VETVPERDALAKVRRRLLPFLFVLYIVAYLDRVNVGFAQLQMRTALGFGDRVYALGAGIFFVGYFLFEVPSNLALRRFGARLWISRIMIVWGAVAASMALVRTPAAFHALRFVLGAGEAGFFPGVILYLTAWFPAAHRARAFGLFLTATAVAGVVGGPVSGALLALDGALGLAGWQWVFVAEGIPAVLLGLVVLLVLPERPAGARWLSPAERDALESRLAAEDAPAPGQARTWLEALGSGRVWLLAAIYFAVVIGFYGVGLWLPIIVEPMARGRPVAVGLLAALPYLAAVGGLVFVGRSSDRTGERRWHVALPALLAAGALAVGAAARSPAALLASLCVAAFGIWGTLGPFWALPPTFLRGYGAAAGIALVNSVGNLGGFFGPNLIGLLRERTGGFGAGFLALAAALVAAAGLVLLHAPPGTPRPATDLLAFFTALPRTVRYARRRGRARRLEEMGRLEEARAALVDLRRMLARPTSVRVPAIWTTRLFTLAHLADVAWRLGDRALAREALTEWIWVHDQAVKEHPALRELPEVEEWERWVRDFRTRLGPTAGP